MSRANDILNQLRTGTQSQQQTINALYNLKDWARAEVASAATSAYRNKWQAEVDATQTAIASLLRGDA